MRSKTREETVLWETFSPPVERVDGNEKELGERLVMLFLGTDLLRIQYRKAVCHMITARLLYIVSASPPSTHIHFTRTIGIVCCIPFEAVHPSSLGCRSNST
jgi:hypothetical protein